jgi:uncharacterized protein YjbJ (UPF0337 family)
MAQEPDRIRSDIESTRTALTRDVDLLTEKTSPAKVARRQWGTLKEKVMGSTPKHATQNAAASVQDAAGSVKEAAGTATDAVKDAPQKVAGATQGNPLAAGVIAFGVGLLAASIIPATEAEKRAGRQVKDNAGDLVEPLKEPARQIADDVKGSVQDAAQEVKGTAVDAAQTTKEEARQSAKNAV